MIEPGFNTKLGTAPDKYFADIICGPSNLNAIILVQGPTGAGKSYFAMSLAQGIAKKVASLKGGVPNDYWPEDLSNMSIITIDSVKDIMLRDNKQYSIIVLDDIGTSYSNRSWQSKSNSILNGIIMTFRPKNQILILTVPSQGMVDLNARRLAHYLIELERNPAAFRMGVGVGKMFKLVPQRSGKIFAQYIIENGNKVVRTVVPKPPEAMCKLYETRRDAEFERIMQRYLDEWDAYEAKENAKIYGTDDKEKKKQDKASQKALIFEMRSMGSTQKEIAKEVGLTRERIGQIIRGE